MAKEQVLVPDIGGAEAAEVVELLVSPGDTISVEQGLIVLESDKASMEIPSTLEGTLVELLVKEGDQLAEGAPFAVIETTGAAASDDEGEGSAEAAEEPQDSAPESVATESGKDDAPAVADDAPDASADAASKTSMDVQVPDIGTSDPVDLVELCVAVGDRVNEGDSLVILESDKASMEVPAPQAGEVLEILVSSGQKVSEGDLLLRLAAEGAAQPSGSSPAVEEKRASATQPETDPATPQPATPQPATPQPATPQPATPEKPAPARTPPSGGAEEAKSATVAPPLRNVYAGPAVRKLAREFGIDLAQVKGSGPRGRLLKEDLHGYVQKQLSETPEPTGGVLPVVPEVDFAAFGPVRIEQRSKLDKLTAANMQRSWLNVPHVTQFDDADITELEAFRKSLKAEAEQRGTRLTPLPFLMKACAVALQQHPKLNASLSDGGSALAFKDYIHIGMAVDTPAGLLVPVVRDVDQKSLWELAEEVLSLAALARDRKLKPAQMQGGCFTISSLGGIGGRGFTPIVNTPEVGILGVSRASVQPVWDGSSFQPRTMLPLALSYDHRVVNGGDGGRFLSDLTSLLADIRRLIL